MTAARNSRILWTVPFMLIVAVLCPFTYGKIIYVHDDATGANDGSSWENAYKYLQDALADANSAEEPVEIRVAQGAYKPDQGAKQTPGNRQATFQLISAVTLKGGYAGFGEPDPDARDIQRCETILTGDVKGDDEPNFTNNGENSYHVVTGGGCDETGVLDGFTITAGKANGPHRLDNCGGGMHNHSGSPTVSNCTFRENSAVILGAGMHNFEASPTIANCTFKANLASTGGGMFNDSSSPTLTNSIFSENSAVFGGGMGNIYLSNPELVNCLFIGNSARMGGGGMKNTGILYSRCRPTLTNCTFTENSGGSCGGGIDSSNSYAELTNCTFDRNTAELGGGMYDLDVSATLVNCTFRGNSANIAGGISSDQSRLVLTNCAFSGNYAGTGGGILFIRATATLTNCIFSGNRAGFNYPSASQPPWYSNGGGILCVDSNPTLVNCTFSGNSANEGRVMCNVRGRSATLTNCILWDGGYEILNAEGARTNITYSNVQAGSAGKGNIDTDPLFVDSGGADNVFGTEDDNLRLLPDSPCINTGNNLAVPESVHADLDGNLRIRNGIVDMGAYEFRGPLSLYVDVFNGDDNNDGLSLERAFATIQNGIDATEHGDTVLVYPGVYQQEINFLGKAITVQGVAGVAGIPILENPGDFAVSFYHSEGADSILKNFVIRDSFMAILIAGSSPTITNVTVVDNKYGVEAYANSEPDISNSIFWDNTHSNLFQCEARYSCIEGIDPGVGEGNISADPLFVDPQSGDYHLGSERGRYWPEHDIWVLDKVSSPCINGGDPAADYSGEPIPNGGRINMGAYGGTAYASMSETWWLDGDINHDNTVNMIDLAMLAENWLKHDEKPALNHPPQVNVTAPLDGALFSRHQTIEIKAEASDIDGFVAKVEFLANGNNIGEDMDGSDGWAMDWSTWMPDEYKLIARATDNDGASTDSTAVQIIARYGVL